MEKSSQHVPPSNPTGAATAAVQTGSAGSSAATDRAPSSGGASRDAGSGGAAGGAASGRGGGGEDAGGAMSRGRPAVSSDEIQQVQNLIERCMQQYMTQVRGGPVLLSQRIYG